MTFIPFETCRQRTERAALHGKALAELWNGLDTGSAYSTRIDFQDDGTGEIFIEPVNRDWFGQFSLQYGEMLYHLRAALDSCVYDTAVFHTRKNPPDNESALGFPICESDVQFKKSARRIAPLPDKLKTFIEAVQPYKSYVMKNNLGIWQLSDILATLGKWSMIDRHRRLNIVGTIPTRGTIQVHPPSGMTLENLTFESGGILEDKSKIGVCKIGNFVRGSKIGVKTQLAFEIAVKDGDAIVIASNSGPAMLIVVWEIMEKFKKLLGI